MRELALHLLDIARNAIEAGATELELLVREDAEADLVCLSVRDNGRGMDAATARRALDPFFSTKEVRRQGLGLPLLKSACERCGGSLEIGSSSGGGTTVRGTMRLSHLDRPPRGNMGALIQALVLETERVRLRYRHEVGSGVLELDSEQLRHECGWENLTDPAVLCRLRQRVNEALAALSTG